MTNNMNHIKDACIVMPTYNEAKNIISLMDKIFLAEKNNFSKYKVSLKILVVDDNSPDGTAALVKKYKMYNKKVFLLERNKKEGLGAAYIAGMKHAIKTINPDIVFEMDADHSHNPKYIYPMIEAVQNGADFVIGSRYISGGGVSKGWGFHRYLISGLAGHITRIGLRLGKIKDCSGGFRAIRVEKLKNLDLDKLDVRGYAFQAVLLESAVHNKWKVVEIPIVFNQRNAGESKMRFSDMTEGLMIVYKIRKMRFFENAKRK